MARLPNSLRRLTIFSIHDLGTFFHITRFNESRARELTINTQHLFGLNGSLDHLEKLNLDYDVLKFTDLPQLPNLSLPRLARVQIVAHRFFETCELPSNKDCLTRLQKVFPPCYISPCST